LVVILGVTSCTNDISEHNKAGFDTGLWEGIMHPVRHISAFWRDPDPHEVLIKCVKYNTGITFAVGIILGTRIGFILLEAVMFPFAPLFCIPNIVITVAEIYYIVELIQIFRPISI
jgi:hypothetical protein